MVNNIAKNETPMEWILTDIEKDLFKEIANIGLSKAADSLAVIAKERILLTVPDVRILKAETHFDISSFGCDEDRTLIVLSDIKGDIEGKTLLFFSENEAEKLLRTVLSSLDGIKIDEQELKNSLLLEVSNIITGAIVTQFANLFDIQVHTGVPRFALTALNQVLIEARKDFSSFQPILFTIKTNFVNDDKMCQLPLLLMLDTDTLLKLISLIRMAEHDDKFKFLTKR